MSEVSDVPSQPFSGSPTPEADVDSREPESAREAPGDKLNGRKTSAKKSRKPLHPVHRAAHRPPVEDSMRGRARHWWRLAQLAADLGRSTLAPQYLRDTLKGKIPHWLRPSIAHLRKFLTYPLDKLQRNPTRDELYAVQTRIWCFVALGGWNAPGGFKIPSSAEENPSAEAAAAASPRFGEWTKGYTETEILTVQPRGLLVRGPDDKAIKGCVEEILDAELQGRAFYRVLGKENRDPHLVSKQTKSLYFDVMKLYVSQLLRGLHLEAHEDALLKVLVEIHDRQSAQTSPWDAWKELRRDLCQLACELQAEVRAHAPPPPPEEASSDLGEAPIANGVHDDVPAERETECASA
jgi:hypothetical protein